jgi:DNA-binding NtrC family response regulator
VNPRIRIESGTLRGSEFEIASAFVIGRATSCDLVLSDDSCSRLHARFTAEGGRVKLEDLGSTNGTLVNGERTRLHFLEDGDRITIGDTAFSFKRGAFDGSKTVILSAPARDNANVSDELSLEPPAFEPDPEFESRALTVLLDLVEATRAAPESHSIGRALCGAISSLLETSRAALLMFRGASPDVHDAQQVSVPDLRLDAGKPWIGRALSRRRALFLNEKSKSGKNALHGLVLPHFDRDRPVALLYADRRGKPFRSIEYVAALRLISVGGALLQTAFLHERVRGELGEYRARTDAERRIIGQTEAHKLAIQAVRNHASTDDQAILFIGETGTGKELLARLLHDASPRREGPFYTLNCSVNSGAALEAELFGAHGTNDGDERPGALERATGGTFFLDEVDALDLATQARLAQVLRSGRLARSPGGREIQLDVRLVAASDRDLATLSKDGAFHEELLALLAMATIRIPPLRERGEDIPLLADHFLKLHARHMNRNARRITPETLRRLGAYSWPGNVRELSNVIERAVMLCTDGDITPDLLPFAPDQALTEHELSLDFVEKIAIERALAFVGGRKGQAAKVLGISWPTLNKKIADYGIEMPEK